MRIKESGYLSEEKEANRIGGRYPGDSIGICQCNSLFLKKKKAYMLLYIWNISMT